FVIKDAAAAEAEVHLAGEEFLKVGQASGHAGATGGADEEKLTIENLGKELVEVYPSVVAAKTKDMGAFHPTHGIHKVVIVLGLELIGGGGGAHLANTTSDAGFLYEIVV